MCVGLFPTYATALDDAQENRNGRRLIIPKTGITSLTFFYVSVGNNKSNLEYEQKDVRLNVLKLKITALENLSSSLEISTELQNINFNQQHRET